MNIDSLSSTEFRRETLLDALLEACGIFIMIQAVLNDFEGWLSVRAPCVVRHYKLQLMISQF